MLRDILYKGKELADKVTNIMMNYTEVELKVREATNDEICCPHGRLLQKLADYTYTHDTFLEVMSVLWKRMHSDGNCSWRRVYKSLFVLAFLLRNGSDYVAQAARDHIYDIRTLESFRYFDENGKDQGMNVRIKVQEVIDLLQDPEKLQEERQKAKASRHLYTGYGNANESDWGYSSYGSRGGGGGGGGGTDYYRRSDSFDNYDKDDYISKSYTFQSHTTPKPPTMPRLESDLPPPRLGSFDDWHVGKERGVIDDVLEQFKEAWDMAKESTKDLIFTKKSPDIRTNESNPRMVSEEVYEFPPDAVETGGTYELRTHSAGYGNDHPPVQNKFSSSINSSNLSSINQRNSNVINNNNNNSIHGKPHSNGRSVDHMQKVIVEPRQPDSSRNNPKPRPPSCDLMDSFGNLTIGSNQVIDLFDTCDTIHSPTGSTNSQRQQQQQHQQQSQHVQNAFVESWPESLTPSNVSSKTNTNQNYSPISYQNHDNLLDNEFGDFTSATVQSSSIPVNASTAVTNSSLLSFDDIDFPSSNTNYQTTGGQNQSFWNKPAEENRQQQQQQQQEPLQSNPTSPSKGKSLNIGSTWKDLETLSIDLDSLVKPEKYGTRAQAPSLHQLKQSQQRVQS
ncbi:unnamed protein product [Trichobilharzia szidati]|nr:unnamed protein product [Trichobilharzia szidati]